MKLEPRDPKFEVRTRASFDKQRVMKLIGAKLVSVEPGSVTIELPYKDSLTQQNEYLHAGITTTIADSACGYSASTLREAGKNVLTVEYKVNLLAPAIGERFVAKGQVLKSGRTLSVCQSTVIATDANGIETKVLTMLATIMEVTDRVAD